MSHWFEIEDKEDISVDEEREDLHILYDSDDFGNNYVSVPIRYIIDALKSVGYEVIKPG